MVPRQPYAFTNCEMLLLRRMRVTFRLVTCPRFTHTMPNKTAHPFDKARLDALLNRRFFYAPAFEIYGGASLDPPLTPLTPTRRRRSLRLWPTGIVPPGQHHRRMAPPFYRS